MNTLLALLISFLLSIFTATTPLEPAQNFQAEQAKTAILGETDTSDESDTLQEEFTVGRVIDGDTIELITGEKIRYIGIDTPETKDPNRPDGCFGKEAYQKNKELVEGKTVQLEKDVNNTDRYGRLLRYVYVDGVLINEKLVQEGYAVARSYPPDIKYQEKLKEAETYAREHELGLWGDACESI